MKNFINFVESLTDISKRYNIAINADFSEAPAGKKITYASRDRSHTVKNHNSFLSEIELLTASTRITLSGSINFIDLNGLTEFDRYKIDSNHITAIAKDISLRNIKQTRIHKFIFINNA